VRYAGTISVQRLWNSIMLVVMEKTSVYQIKDIHEVGSELKQNLISAFSYVPIVTVNFMLKAQLSREIGIDKAG